MDVVGLGLDLTSIDRIASTLAGVRGARFLRRVFTVREREYCDRRRNPGLRAAAYAARFAAKEAFVKALGVPKGISWQSIEVIRRRGAPTLLLTGKAAEALAARNGSTLLTLSHDAGVAAAVVVITAPDPGGS